MVSSAHEGPFKAPLYFAAINGHLDQIPDVTAGNLRAVGALTWARNQILEFYNYKDKVTAITNNIVGCPELGAALRINADNYQGKLARSLLSAVLKHPGLTPEKRAQLGKHNKQITAELL